MTGLTSRQWSESLQSYMQLPQPLHLMELLTRSRHYHCGFFRSPDESLESALDALVLEALRPIRDAESVLDVGCSMGGSVEMLAARGKRVVGVDPCNLSIKYARSASSDSAVYVECRLEDLEAARLESRFDAVLLIEVLQHFPDLHAALSNCLRHLNGRGRIVVCDMVLVPRLEWDHVPLHRRGDLIDAATGLGLIVSEHHDVTSNVFPTYSRLLERLVSKRDEMVHRLSEYRESVRSEVDELIEQLQNLRAGMDGGDLRYQITALQRSAGE